jgi:hypothetical protein
LISHRLQTTLPRCRRYQTGTAEYLQMATTQSNSGCDLWVQIVYLTERW